MAQSRIGPFVLVAIVIVGCLAAGAWLSVSDRPAPSLVISVLLACAVAALLYSILGGVGEAGFTLGPIKMGGSAAVLIGGAYLFDMLLEPQLAALRDAGSEARLAAARFLFDKHVAPAEGWFAIDRETGAPLAVRFMDPTGIEQPRWVRPPNRATLRLQLGEKGRDNYHLVSGTGAEAGLGYMNHEHLKDMLGSLGDLEPGATYGPRRLHLAREGELPLDKPRTWGLGECVRNMLPLQVTVQRFYESAALYEVRPCESAEAVTSSLRPGRADLHRFAIGGRERTFVIAVVAADHQAAPFWSSFLVIEMVERAD